MAKKSSVKKNQDPRYADPRPKSDPRTRRSDPKSEYKSKGKAGWSR